MISACGGHEDGSDSTGAEQTTAQEAVAAITVLSAPANIDITLPLTDASPPGNIPNLPSGAFGYSHYVFEKVGDRVVTTLVEGPRQEQVRVPVSYMRIKELNESGGPTDQLLMSREELATLVQQLDTVRASTEKYRDLGTALKDGFIQVTAEVPNMGAHFVHLDRSLDGVFDPSQPEILMYMRDATGEWELVGTSFVLPTQLAGTDHP